MQFFSKAEKREEKINNTTFVCLIGSCSVEILSETQKEPVSHQGSNFSSSCFSLNYLFPLFSDSFQLLRFFLFLRYTVARVLFKDPALITWLNWIVFVLLAHFLAVVQWVYWIFSFGVWTLEGVGGGNRGINNSSCCYGDAEKLICVWGVFLFPLKGLFWNGAVLIVF